jgi:probable F420-dependent oxidoreductase
MKIGIHALLTENLIGPAELAQAIEERGFDALTLAEHTHIPVRQESPYPMGGPIPTDYRGLLDPFVALAAAAAVTERLVLGTGILLLNQHDPFTAAKQIATLDLISGGGRVLIGVGAGWNLEELANHGVDPTVRGAALAERVDAVRALLTGETAEFHGEHVDFDPVYLDPTRPAGVPIYFGGDSVAALRRVVEHGDGFLAAGIPPEHLAKHMKRLRELSGRDVPVTFLAAFLNQPSMQEYAELGVERVNLFLTPQDRDLSTEPMSRDEVLRQLDSFTAYLDEFKD